MIDTIGLGSTSDKTTKLFEALPFSFVVVGPLYQNLVNVDDSEDDSYLCIQDPPSSSPTNLDARESKEEERVLAPESPHPNLRGLRA